MSPDRISARLERIEADLRAVAFHIADGPNSAFRGTHGLVVIADDIVDLRLAIEYAEIMGRVPA